MNKKFFHVSGFFFASVIGTLLHFTYDFFDNNELVSYFSSVNESTWEHLKLIFWPFVFWSIIEFFAYGKRECDFFAVKLASVLGAMVFVVVFFYTYTGILGFNLFFLDIFSFFAAVFIANLCSYHLMTSQTRGDFSDNIKGLATIIFIGFCFVLWTKNPPELGLFWG